MTKKSRWSEEEIQKVIDSGAINCCIGAALHAGHDEDCLIFINNQVEKVTKQNFGMTWD